MYDETARKPTLISFDGDGGKKISFTFLHLSPFPVSLDASPAHLFAPDNAKSAWQEKNAFMNVLCSFSKSSFFGDPYTALCQEITFRNGLSWHFRTGRRGLNLLKTT